MSSQDWKNNYIEGIKAYDRANPPTVWARTTEFFGESYELIEAIFWKWDPEEIKNEWEDVKHTLCRLIERFGMGDKALVLATQIAETTARKHASRYADRGCIRSEAHCKAGDHACPAKDD